MKLTKREQRLDNSICELIEMLDGFLAMLRVRQMLRAKLKGGK